MTISMFKKPPLSSLALGFVAFLGTQHVLTRYINRGPDLDRELDSLIYISVADSLIAGDGIINFSGTVSSYWPPLYPITIALIGFLGIDLVQAGLLVNIAAFSLVIMWTGIWLHKYTGSQLLALGGAVTVGTSYTLTWLSSSLLSEPLFICFTLLALAQLGRFSESEGYRQSAIVWSASMAALATITRYLGITVVFAAVVLILMHARLPVLRRLKYTAIYCIISISPVTLYMARNWLHTGHPVGNRSGIGPRKSSTFADMFNQLGEVFDLWLFSKRAPGWLGLVLVIAVGVMAIGMIRIIMGRLVRDLGPVLPFIIFIVIYLAVLVIITPSASHLDIYDRYVAPVYVPVIGVLIVLFHRSYKSIILDKSWVVKWIAILIILGCGVVGWFAVVNRAARLSFNETADKVERITLSIKGYTRNSGTVDYLISNPINGTIYSNKAAVLFGMAVLHNVAELKRVDYIHGVDRSELSLDDVIDYIPVDYISEAADSRTCLSWIQRVGESDEQPYLMYLFEEIASEACNPVELESQSTYLELVTRTSDGVIYKVTKPPSSS